MGYRNYIGYISKREHNKIKNFTKEELLTYNNEDIEDGYVGPYDITKELYGFGKYCDFETKKLIKQFFKNKDLQKYYNNESEFYIIGKEFLEAVIKNYTEKIKTYYSNMLKDIDPNNFDSITKEKISEIYVHINGMSTEWNYLTPYDLENGDEITTSWKYEYGLFELIRIYKHFDWKRNIMVYYGY